MIYVGLVNGSWLGIIVVGFFWLILGLYTIVQRNSDIYDQDYDSYDYKQDVPMVNQLNSPIQQHMDVPISPTRRSFSPIQPVNSPSHYPYHPSSFSPVQQQPYYYPQQQGYDDEYYVNPLQEEHINLNYHQQQKMYPQYEEGHERSRRLSKTFVEEDDSNISSQPPHSYDGLYNSSNNNSSSNNNNKN